MTLLESVMSAKVENALTSSEHRVYENGVPITYEVTDEIQSDDSVILSRLSDGKEFVVSFTVTVEERHP
jgi:hypothetical protein